MMHILEDFKDVAEAVDYLKSVPLMGGGNLVFADAAGNIGSAEVGYQNVDLVQRDRGFLVCTNHFQGLSMLNRYRQRVEIKERDSKSRYGEVSRRLSIWNNGIDLDQVKELMAFHGEAFAICNHGGLHCSEETSTLSSALFLPGEKGFYYCQGFPCLTPYEWISFKPDKE